MRRHMSNTKRSFLTVQILKVTFAIYFIVTLTVTIIHMRAEYIHIKQETLKELSAMQETFEPVLTQSLWRLDRFQWESTLKGMMKSPILVGVKLQDNDQILYLSGITLDNNGNVTTTNDNHFENKENATIYTQLLEHDFTLIYTGQQVGKVTLYSSNKVIYQKVKVGFFFIILNSIIKTITLWILFVWIGYRLLNRPLRIMIDKLQDFHLDRLDCFRMDINTKHRNELNILEDAFNSMIDKLLRSLKELKNSENRFKVIFKYSNIGIALGNYQGDLIDVNAEFARQVGYSKEELIHMNFAQLTHPDDLKKEKVLFEKLASGEIENYRIEKRYIQKNNDIRFVDIAVTCRRNIGDEINLFIAMVMDVTDRKKTEKQIEQSLKEKETLLREIHHRVKNNMQKISSLLSLQSANIDDPEYKNIFQESKNRIQSMVIIHEHLYKSSNFSNINFESYVRELYSHLFSSYRSQKTINLITEFEKCDLTIDHIITCGLIINEIISNSFKHAFNHKDNGTIKVCFKTIEKNMRMLSVFDDGCGLPPDIDFEQNDTLGLRLIKMLSEKQLEGRLDINNEKGLCYTIIFKSD